jgi:hypothetical protein
VVNPPPGVTETSESGKTAALLPDEAALNRQASPQRRVHAAAMCRLLTRRRVSQGLVASSRCDDITARRRTAAQGARDVIALC